MFNVLSKSLLVEDSSQESTMPFVFNRETVVEHIVEPQFNLEYFLKETPVIIHNRMELISNFKGVIPIRIIEDDSDVKVLFNVKDSEFNEFYGVLQQPKELLLKEQTKEELAIGLVELIDNMSFGFKEHLSTFFQTTGGK